MDGKNSTTTLDRFERALAKGREALRRSKEASAAAQTAQTHHDKKWQERQLEELKEVKESRRQTRERMAEFHKVSMGILSRLAAKSTAVPTDNQEEQPVSPKDTPECNTWQKKLDNPTKYPWMTILETLNALGGCSDKSVYRYLDERKLEYYSKIRPIRVKTGSVKRLLKEKSEESG